MARNKFTVNPSTDIHLVDAVLTRYNDSELEIDVNAVNTDAELQRGDADKKEEVLSEAPDGGYGWIVVFCVFFMFIYVYGVPNGLSALLYSELLDYFGTDKPTTAWVGSLQYGILFMSGILAGGLIQTMGSRSVAVSGGVLVACGLALSALAHQVWVLYITYSVVSGIGLGFMNTAGLTVLQHYFKRKQTLATGLAVCGAGIGTMVIPIVTTHIIADFGWKGICLLFGGLALLCCVFGALLIPLPSEKENMVTVFKRTRKYGIRNLYIPGIIFADMHAMKYSKSTTRFIKQRQTSKAKRIALDLFDFLKQVFDFSILKDLNVILYAMMFLCFVMAIQVSIQYTPARALSKGISKQDASYLSSMIGGMSIAGRVIGGLLGIIPSFARRQNVIYLYIAFVFVCGASQMFSPFFDNYILLSISASVLGFTYGGSAALFVPVIRSFVDLKVLARAVGVCFGISGIGALVSGPFSGWLHDLTGGYDAAYYFAGCCYIAATLFVAVVPVRIHFQNKRIEKQLKLKTSASSATITTILSKMDYRGGEINNAFEQDEQLKFKSSASSASSVTILSDTVSSEGEI